MLEAGFQPDFPAEVAREVQTLNQGAPKNAAPATRDLRSLLWSSIDNDSSRDLDQVEYVDKLPDGTVHLLVGIADVDALRPQRVRHRPARRCRVHFGLYRRGDVPDVAG
jgi:exoribonuclease-2